MGAALCSAALIGVMDLTSANCRMIAIRQAKRRCLFQRVEESVGAAEVNHAIHDEWRRKNSADTDLLIVGYNRRFTPVGVIEKWYIELAVGGKHPSFVLLRGLDLIIPQQLARFDITRFQGAV